MRALLLALLPLPLLAGSPDHVVSLEVLPGWRVEEGRHLAGLRLSLAPGWKTYWRAPGVAGLAPLLDFSASRGVASAELDWPVPEIFYQGDYRSIGYRGEVTIPVELAVDDGPVLFSGTMDIGVCEEVCVPVTLSFSAELPAEGRRDPAIAAALVDRPLTPEEAGARATCAVAPGAEGLALTVRIDLASLGGEEAVVVETADPGLWVSEATSRREGGTLVATAEALALGGAPLALDPSSLRITVLGGGQAVDIRGCAPG